MTTAEIVSADITQREWYTALVDDCKAIVTEAVFTSRWALVEGYHGLGERIVEDANFKKAAKGNLTSLQDLAKNIGVSKRTIYYAEQFYEKYRDLSALPGGKNMTWNKVIKLLPELTDSELALLDRLARVWGVSRPEAIRIMLRSATAES